MANAQSYPTDITVNHKPSGGLYLLTSQQNLVSGNSTLVNLNTVISGFSDGIEDTANKKITVTKAGLYLVQAQVTFFSVVAAKHYQIHIYKDAAGKKAGYGHSSVTDELSIPLSFFIRCAVNESILMKAISFAGVDTVDIRNGADLTFLELHYMRE